MSQPDRTPMSSQSRLRMTRLRAEAKAPFKGLRKGLYLLFAASAVMGGSIFLFRLLAGWDFSENFSNLALQLAVLGLMIGLWRWEK